MKLIICVDPDFGMLFNGRRQSRDENLVMDILELIKHKRLWMNEYSSKLFKKKINIKINNDFLNKAKANDYCFVENVAVGNQSEKFDEIIIYKWDKKYPADMFFDIDIKNDQWELVENKEFEGNSHEKIIREIWRKNYE